jgi:UDP:flavonoid glycosyltransferase YjiC (YdhE family)
MPLTVGRFLLALHDAGGTVPPMMAIAEALADRGHQVTVLGQPSVEAPAVRAGAAFLAFSVPDYDHDRPIEEQLETVMPLTVGKGPADELLAAVADTGADLVVVDANLAGVAAAAEASSARSAILFHSLWATYVDVWFGELWPFLDAPINETRDAYGLPAAGSWSEVFRPHDRRLAVVPAAFEAPTSVEDPPTFAHFGFLIPTAPELETPLDLRRRHEQAVLISLSTTDMAQASLLQTILDALDGMEVDALLTTGRQVFPPSLRVPANVEVRGHVPHAAVLPHVDAVITHAGMGTVAAALSQGVPLVCTPISRDQPLNAGRVTELGAGLTVPAADATPEQVRAALEQVLSDPSYRTAAQRLAQASADAGGAAALATDLEALAAS